MLVAVDQASSAATLAWVPGAAVAALALLFTVGSFWWLNARTGSLKTFEPTTFAGASTPVRLLLRFPLLIQNTGAAPIVVLDLRLRFPNERGALDQLPWRTSRSALKPDAADLDPAQLPAPFVCPGRTVERHFIEFGVDDPGALLESRDYAVEIEAQLGHKGGEWETLMKFPLRASQIRYPSSYIAYSNCAS